MQTHVQTIKAIGHSPNTNLTDAVGNTVCSCFSICIKLGCYNIYALKVQLSKYIHFLLEYNACKHNPCRNGAICNRRGNNYWCACGYNYDGKNCEGDYLIKY